MKKILNLTILFITMLSLTFIPVGSVNAAKKVNLTYHVGNGYFKAKLNRSKQKITIKNKVNKKRGYAPAIRREGYAFNGWYTKKKGGKRYLPSTIVTKKQKLYAHWLKKYKINTKYFTPMGLTYFKLTDFEPYWGKFKVIKKKKWSSGYDYTLKNSKGDLFTVYSDDNSSNNNHSTEYGYSSTDCKLKNIINIKKPINYQKFLKKLGVTAYNYDPDNNYFEFVCGKTLIEDEYSYDDEDEDDEDNNGYEDIDIVWMMSLNNKEQVTPNTSVSFELNDDWEMW